MDDTKLHKLIATTKTTSKNATKYDKHNSHLPFSVLSNDHLKSFSFNSNSKPSSGHINITSNMGELNLDVNSDKYDFFYRY